MSGYKRAMIRISQEEYRRLHQVDMQTRFSKTCPVIKPSSDETDLTNFKRIAKIEQQQDLFNNLVDQISSEIGTIEANYQKDLLEQQSIFQDTLSAQFDKIWHNEQTLDQILSFFENRARMDQMLLQSHFEKTNEFFNTHIQTEHSKAEMAEEWLERSRSIGLFIRDNYDHERFLPGKFTGIIREVNLAQRNIIQGVYESAINSSQSAYLKLSDLRVELDQAIFNWNSLFDTTWQAVKGLYELVRDNPSCNALDLDGQELPISLELDFWSNGHYSMLVNKIREIIVALRSDHSSLSSSQLLDYLEVQLPQLKNEFDDLVFRVRYSAINSQLRVNIADLAVHALKSQGFIPDTNGYQDNDQRNCYFTRLVNIEGSRITIQVDPVDDLETTNDIVLITEDLRPKFQPEVRKRADLILRSLQQWGLHVGQLQTSPRFQESLIDPGDPGLIKQSRLDQKTTQMQRTDYGRAN